MKLETIIKGTPVTLPEILDAREARVFRQKELLEKGVRLMSAESSALASGAAPADSSIPASEAAPIVDSASASETAPTANVAPTSETASTYSLISFSMNIAGEIKSFPLCLAAFDEGLKELRARIPADKFLHFEESRKNTGPEAFFLLSMDAETTKKLTTSIEESHPIGRLFDMDVLGPDGKSISRSALGLPSRTCLICGENAKACARSRNHTLEVILWRTAQILNDFFKGRAADAAAACAVRALLYEVSTTPKPGLVDRNNSGSHKDMDFFTFLDSSAALIPWFRDFFCVGWDHCDETDAQIFSRLRFAGQEAETSMFAATKHVNTHKGLIFASAIILGALGKAYAVQNCLESTRQAPRNLVINSFVELDDVLSLCRQIGGYALEDFKPTAPLSCSRSKPGQPLANSDTKPAKPSANSNAKLAQPQTAGERLHTTYGITGARGEAAAGFPSALTYGLPALKHWLSQGFSLNDASALALLTMLSQVDDTNMIHRGGLELAIESKKEAGALLSEITPDNFKEKLAALDTNYIEKNLSPGGCADLLAISLLFLFLENSGMICSK